MRRSKTLPLVCSLLLGFLCGLLPHTVGAEKLPPLKKQNARLQPLPTAQSHISRGAWLIANLIHARELQSVRESGIQAPKREGSLTDVPGQTMGRGDAERRIGGRPAVADQSTESALPHDPLTGHRNPKPRGTVVGPGTLPGKDSLTRQDGGGDTATEYQDGSGSSHGPVWVERGTRRQSSDGTRTWGSTLYRDYAGNHWRVDYADTRRDDGTLVSKETVFDGHGEAVKTTVREGFRDGSATETTTTHATGEVTQTAGTWVKIFPERSVDPDAQGRGDAVAPRGWHNPITGATQNPGLRTGNNQVNPGREQSQPRAAKPLHLDPRDLVINPAPDAVVGGEKRPRNIREGDPTIIDPPRPPK